MHPSDDDIHNLTEADRTSETRFGPRPVPKGHKTASPYPHRPMRSSRVIPSAPMSPDGREAYPAPALSTKMIVWGGVALGVAGLTAGALLAARRLAGDDEPPAVQEARRDRKPAPRFADPRDDEGERIGRREPVREDNLQAVKPRAEAAGCRKPTRRNVARELTDTANDLSGSLNGVAQSLVSAFIGFRSVASQANGIVSEFLETADQLRRLTDRARPPASDEAPAPRTPEQKRTHSL